MARRLLGLLVGAAILGSAAPVVAIGFIDSPTPYCRKAARKGECLISWQYLAIDAAPNVMTDLWVFLEDKLVFHASGFFQTSMYVANEALGEGLPVKCGPSGATPGPDPPPSFPLAYGASFSYTIRARDSAGLFASNYGTVICPPR